MPVYKASQVRFIGGDRPRVLGDLIANLFLAPAAPELLDLRVIYLGENEFLGVYKRSDGSEVDTRSGEYRIELTFASELDRRGAFQLAEHHFGTITEGLIELEGPNAGDLLEVLERGPQVDDRFAADLDEIRRGVPAPERGPKN